MTGRRSTGLTRTEPADPMVLAGALAGAAAAIARLDQALASHPLAQAFLYRARLESVRRQAAVDGQLIDPWHLAATIEGLRLRMDPYLRIIDRGDILDKARAALDPAPVDRRAGFRSGGRGAARRGDAGDAAGVAAAADRRGTGPPEMDRDAAKPARPCGRR